MKNTEHLNLYATRLSEVLVQKCTSKGFLDGNLLEVEELDEKWKEMAPSYMADAVPEINNYPAVAIAWAAYLGMGLAAMWDGAWDEHKQIKELYGLFREPNGFDAMDEYIVEKMLGLELDSTENRDLEDLLLGCAHTAMSMIRNERFEPQSADAFYVFAATAKVFFRLGVSLELKQLGYKYTKVKVELPN